MEQTELKVLLLEDNPGDAFLIKFYLGESASPIFHVSHAETMKATLELLSENTFDIVITDMNLPDSFGMDTIKTILSNYPGNMLIVLTGLSDEEVGLETVRYGAQDFLVKGKFDGKVLISTIMFAFERFKLNKQIDSVSKQLNEENTRFDLIQELLKVGYLELDIEKQTIFQTDQALAITGRGQDRKHITYEDGIGVIENTEEVHKMVQQAIAENGRGSFRSKRREDGKEFDIFYAALGKKFCAVVKAVE